MGFTTDKFVNSNFLVLEESKEKYIKRDKIIFWTVLFTWTVRKLDWEYLDSFGNVVLDENEEDKIVRKVINEQLLEEEGISK